jgi:hypothetical protein
MTPIHELFSRMRWDAAFAAGDFVTGYYDRVERKITEVPFGRVRLVPGDRFSFFHRKPARKTNTSHLMRGIAAMRPCPETGPCVLYKTYGLVRCFLL